MMKEPIRILHVVGRMDRGGIETMLMNLYRNIDREKVQFDFLAHYGREAAYNDEIRSMGGRIYEMPALKSEDRAYYWRFFQYIFALRKFFREHKEYKIVHGHMTNTACFYMPIAKKNGVKHCIAHSHSTHGKAGLFGLVTNLLQRPVFKHATDWFACSEAAAGWLYPKTVIQSGRVHLVPNAIDAKKFRFDPQVRERMRRELGIEGKLAIGCVGRFRQEKNQGYLVGVLQELLKSRSDAVIVFAGDGPCEEAVRRSGEEAGISDRLIFLGMRSDIPEIMQALDVLAMPSVFEGLPVTGIEAQASGLPILASEGVTREMNVLGMVEYLPLEASAKAWAEKLAMLAERPREDTYAQMSATGYDIHTTAPWLQEFYLACAAESEPVK